MPSCANGGAQTKSPAEAGPVKREKSNETGRQSHLLPGKIEVMGGKAVLQAVQTRQRHGRPAPASLTKPVAHIIHGQPGHAVPRPPPGRRCWSVPLTVFSRLKTLPRTTAPRHVPSPGDACAVERTAGGLQQSGHLHRRPFAAARCGNAALLEARRNGPQ